MLNFVGSTNILVDSRSATVGQTICLKKTVNHQVRRMGIALPISYLKAYSLHGIGKKRCELKNFNVLFKVLFGFL